jgi:hypothetical protein
MHKAGYKWTAAMLQRRAQEGSNLQSAFTTVIEPYVGEPFITAQRQLQIVDNDSDAFKAVAVEIQTRNGHKDVCFADGRPQKVRKVGDLQIAGEFAFYSTDENGLRQAALTGGTVLDGPELRMQIAQPQRTGKVVKVDYLNKTMLIEGVWPQAATGRPFEIGVAGHWTAYTPVAIRSDAGNTWITVERGGDFYRSQIEQIAEDGKVKCVLSFADGFDKNDWVASNDQMTKFWRADRVGNTEFQLKGGAVSKEDFAPSGALRLWEYGPGDTLRQSTFASLRRIATDTYELTSDVPVTLSLKVRSIEVCQDGKNWKPAQTQGEGAWQRLQIGGERPDAVLVRVGR